jgi:hypothetical protein
MPLKQALELIGRALAMYLSSGIFKKRSGKVVVTINLADGGIGSVEVSTQQRFLAGDLEGGDD